MELTSTTIVNAQVIDKVAKVAVPTCTGVSTGPYGTRVHLPDGTSQANQDKVQDAIDNWNSLVVTASVSSMDEGDSDPVVTCADASISADAEVGYLILFDGVEYADGLDTVTAGESELTLISPEAGVYDIYVWRTVGNFASGHVQITVNEV
jgi:hypothetical protein